MIEIDGLRLAQRILRGVQQVGRLQWRGRLPCQPDSRADTLVQRSDGERRKMIDALPLFPQDEDTQTIDEIGREKLADLRNFADALKHTLAKLRLRRDALHHGGEKLGRRIGFLRRESTRHQKTESQEAQRDVCWSTVVEGTCCLRHVAGLRSGRRPQATACRWKRKSSGNFGVSGDSDTMKAERPGWRNRQTQRT